MLKGITALFSIVGVSLHLVSAELPPWVYADWKASAQKKLVLHVDNVTTTSETEIGTSQDNCTLVTLYYEVEATVTRVQRSTDLLGTGDVVSFEYERNGNDGDCLPPPGASQPMSLETEDCVLAYNLRVPINVR